MRMDSAEISKATGVWIIGLAICALTFFVEPILNYLSGSSSYSYERAGVLRAINFFFLALGAFVVTFFSRIRPLGQGGCFGLTLFVILLLIQGFDQATRSGRGDFDGLHGFLNYVAIVGLILAATVIPGILIGLLARRVFQRMKSSSRS